MPLIALNVLLLGPQGAGKGTQAKRIAAEHGVPHIATGDILRDAAAAGTRLGLEADAIMKRGELVPDETMVELIRERLSQSDTEDGFVLDGFPRTLAQAEALDAMMRELGRSFTVVLALLVPDDVARERLMRRAAEEGRADDTPEAIERRLEVYDRETAPLVEYYRSTRGNVVGIHADRAIDEVFREVQQSLSSVEARA